MPEESSSLECVEASLSEGGTQELPAFFPAAAAAVTSGMPATSAPATEGVTSVLLPSASEDGTRVFMVDEEQLEHQKKKRKLEIELLEEQIQAQRAIKVAMKKFAEVCDSWNKNTK